jgi:excisionase family DNA binding protein
LKWAYIDHLKAIIDGMPDGGSVSLPVTWMRDLLDAEGDSPGMGRLLTLKEAGEVVGRSPSTVRTWLNTSRLAGFKLNGRTWRIRESALRSFIERQESGEHEPPTIRSYGSVELGDWRNHVRSGFDQF